MKKTFIALLFIIAAIQITAAKTKKEFQIKAGQTITVACDQSEEAVVKTALGLLTKDCKNVFSSHIVVNSKRGEIIVGTIHKSPLLKRCGIDVSAIENKKQAFIVAVNPKGKLVVAGSDQLGTAYGILEISRLIGVSPWEWWADAVPAKKTSFKLAADFRTVQWPSVEYRGIFINDEDWGMLPWSTKTYDPSSPSNSIGPRTTARIFELLLRLRANTFWPAMHPCTYPFFLTKGNREMAAKYGIYIGTSHCEPMACNAAGEWKLRGHGAYDYVHNDSAVYKFWEARVKDVAGQHIIYTLGMRGVHDGPMEGAKTIPEKKMALKRIIKDERGLIRKYVNKDVTKVPQIFIPYKEVLDVYNAGLKVPDDVTLVWTDDNYGYIRHFPTKEERARKGGNGVYYHVSYWGRPHDYLWLCTTSPSLIYQQMKLAYDTGIRKIWILNVGDLKPAEYDIELFMDMAWNINKVAEEGVFAHEQHFLDREFGKKVGNQLAPVMKEYYRLAYICKPEFLGNTRVEERNPVYKIVKDMPWSENYIQARLKDYQQLSDKVQDLSTQIPARSRDAYFELVKYPVQAAYQMNKKLLDAELARHGKADWALSDAAYDSIVSLTRIYNKGKWKRMMDFHPRNLPVFNRVKHDTVLTPMVHDRKPLVEWNGADCTGGKPVLYEGLGYEGKAAGIMKNSALTFSFNDPKNDSIEVEVHLLPNHQVDSKHLRIAVSIDQGTPQTTAYETYDRSEGWKENVLRNQAIRRFKFVIKDQPSHQLSIKALDDGVVLDQVMIYRL